MKYFLLDFEEGKFRRTRLHMESTVTEVMKKHCCVLHEKKNVAIPTRSMQIPHEGNKTIHLLAVTEDNNYMGIKIGLFYTMNQLHGQ
jgi:hypothetical protein